jgi:glycosyltransferase involved in cell wall biosynthesis
MKRVLFFGIYDPQYARNLVLETGFRQNGFEVVHCHIDPKSYRGLNKYYRLLKKYRSIDNKRFDIKLVCFPGQSVMLLARILLGKDIVFDAFLSLYDSNVFDRRLYKKYSIRAFRDYLFDYLSVRLAKNVLLDTERHIEYFKATFGYFKDKYMRVFVGTMIDREKVKTCDIEDNLIHFHGHYIPLHGIEYIVGAANILKDSNIKFNIIGRGQEYEKIKKIVEEKGIFNVSLLPNVPFSQLPEYICKARICLGVFGKSEKVDRVIPNKIFEYSALGKVIITGQSQAINEIYEDKKNIYTVPVGDSEALAQKILYVLKNEHEANEVSKNALDIIARYSAEQIVYHLIEQIK